MKLTIQNITDAQREKVTAANKSLQGVLAAVRSNFKAVNDLELKIARAEEQHVVASQKAGVDLDAATKMAALAIQIQHLKPQLRQAVNLAANNLEVAGNIIASIRQEVIAALFGEQLKTEFAEHIEMLLAPFYYDRGFARQAAFNTPSFGILYGFLSRRKPSGMSSRSAAEAEITNTIGELERILSGEPLLDVTAGG